MTTGKRKKEKNIITKKILALFLSITITFLVLFFRNSLKGLGSLGYLGIFLLSMLGNATIIFPVPSVLAAFLGGSILNPFWVGIIAALGATIGEFTGYLAGYGGRAVIENPQKLKKIEKWMEKYGLWTIFMLAIIPNPLFDLAGIASGMFHLPVWKFFFSTWAGKIIKFLGFSYLGAGSLKLLKGFS